MYNKFYYIISISTIVINVIILKIFSNNKKVTFAKDTDFGYRGKVSSKTRNEILFEK